MPKKLVTVTAVAIVVVAGFLLYVASLEDEILIREDVRIYGDITEVQSFLEDVRNWPFLHVKRPKAKSEFSEVTTGPGAFWLQHLLKRDRKMTLESASLKGGVKFRINYGGSQDLECHMAVRKHLIKGLIFVRSAKGKVSFFERLTRHALQKSVRSEIYMGNHYLAKRFGQPEAEEDTPTKN